MSSHGEQIDLLSYAPPSKFSAKAHIKTSADYRRMHKASLEDPEKFWGEILKAAKFQFTDEYDADKFCDYNFDLNKGSVFCKWMPGSSTNVCYNCLDRNVERGLGEKVAFYWEGNQPGDDARITYQELLEEVCKFANVLKRHGLKKGHRVVIYLPMILELPIAMLACARIGVMHSIVFGGYSAEALASRLIDAGSEVIVTANGVFRGASLLSLKNIVDEAITICKQRGHSIRKCIVVRHLRQPSALQNGDNGTYKTGGAEEAPMCNGFKPAGVSDSSLEREGSPLVTFAGTTRSSANLKMNFNEEIDVWYHEEMADMPNTCPVEWMDAEDPLFMLYTSGSTGKPKGVVHTQAGYMLYCYATFRFVFDYQDNDVYFCTADIGWITGHSYVTYGPLLNGATGIIFEGVPFYPDSGRFWAIVQKYRVSKFYTAPTAIRALMKEGEAFVEKYDRSSLQVLGSVGEPINPAAWLWYHEVVGESRCPIVDTYWQTETGGHVMTPLPGCTVLKPGSTTLPFFGVDVVMLDEEGHEMEGPGEGYLAFKRPWPGMMRTVYGNHKRFEQTYFSRFPGYYCTADGCKRDADGYYWVTGRVDDMMNVSGHLLSTAEIESAVVSHCQVAEAAVVPQPHSIKGAVPYCFVTLKNGLILTPSLIDELKLAVRRRIGPVAIPAVFQEAPALPKTRSGKIMRRILRQIAQHGRHASLKQMGDLSTLADEGVVERLMQGAPEIPPVALTNGVA